MKKLLLVTLVILSVFSLQSCTKDYKCVITYSVWFKEKHDTILIEHTTYSDAYSQCQQKTIDLNQDWELRMLVSNQGFQSTLQE